MSKSYILIKIEELPHEADSVEDIESNISRLLGSCGILLESQTFSEDELCLHVKAIHEDSQS